MKYHKISNYRLAAAICFGIFAFLVFPPVSLFFTVPWPFFLAIGLFFWGIDGIYTKNTPTP